MIMGWAKKTRLPAVAWLCVMIDNRRITWICMKNELISSEGERILNEAEVYDESSERFINFFIVFE